MNRPGTIRQDGQRWSVVLAAGNGVRLGHLTRDRAGRVTPKQYCSVAGGPTLLQQTLQRAASLTALDRVVTVVAREHDEWWPYDTRSLPQQNVIVQPQNRGTAAGILLPLLHVAERDPEARVLILPSDHFVRKEPVLQRAIRRAFLAVEGDPSAVVLLGFTPDSADTELGWILPRPTDGAVIRPVEAFVEKPPLELARQLLGRGGLWNSLILVARVSALLALYRRQLSRLVDDLSAAVRTDAGSGKGVIVEALYRGLETHDFSRAVLEANPGALRVLPVDRCGWSDLGTPERLARCAALFPFAAVAKASLRPVLAACV